MSRAIKIVEVGARDGLQNEEKPISIAHRWKLIQGLANSGLKNIEVGAFVSPKWVPQMKGTDKLVKKSLQLKDKNNYSVLVPNAKGMELAIQSGIKEVAIFGACSESFSRKNINCSINESFARFEAVMKMAKPHKIKVRGYLSVAFGCPYEGKVSQAKVVKLVDKMLKLGVYEVSIGDTIGVATPKQVRELLPKLLKRTKAKKLAMHFHDTRGTALANVLASLDHGITTFDSSLGGLGGCPYAKGASGNLATEDLVYMLYGMGYKTGVNVEALVKLKHWIEKLLGNQLPSHVGRSGMPRVKVF